MSKDVARRNDAQFGVVSAALARIGPRGDSGRAQGLAMPGPDEDADGSEIGARLREAVFSDLYFTEHNRVFLTGDADAPGKLSPPPAAAMEDVARLHQIVCERGARDSEFSLDFGGMRFRVARMETVQGTGYVLRRAMWPLPRLGHLLQGVPAAVVRSLVALGADRSKGLILVAGATGQGKTATASSLLVEHLLQFGGVARTVEDPVELPLQGTHGHDGHCFQSELGGRPFGDAVREMMRQRPRYMLIGEIRDASGASAVIRAANNGHVVSSTIHAGDCVEAINSLVKFVAGSEPVDLARQMLADGLAAVVHQDLVTERRDAPERSFVRPRLQWLFLGRGADSKGVRSMIREGKTEQLVSEIARQQRLALQGRGGDLVLPDLLGG